jgi:hypothetical protein
MDQAADKVAALGDVVRALDAIGAPYMLDMGGTRVRVVTTPDLIAMKERAAADPARRQSKALRDRADVALLRGDVPDPDEGW